jgi:hypothetical protein
MIEANRDRHEGLAGRRIVVGGCQSEPQASSREMVVFLLRLDHTERDRLGGAISSYYVLPAGKVSFT